MGTVARERASLLGRALSVTAVCAAAAGICAALMASSAGPDMTAIAAAADALDFQQTHSPDVGIVEDLPADTTLLAPSATVLSVGSIAPDFALSTVDGRTVRLSDFRGKTVLLEFFATWCPHCQAEAHHLLTMSAQLPSSRFAILSVNADSEDAASLFAFDRYFGIPWPTLLDPGERAGNYNRAGGPGPVTQAYGVALYPTFYVIDQNGRITWRNDREQPDALLMQKLLEAAGS